MDHGGMDHGGMDHGDGSGTMQCMGSMSMLWNADFKDTCIVHPVFRIHSLGTLLFYMLAIFGLAVLYEYSRLLPGQLELKIRSASPAGLHRSRRSSNDGMGDPLLGVERSSTPTIWSAARGYYSTSEKIQRSLLYTYNVALSFFLMLVIMTYNAYLIISVLCGAFVGHFMFHSSPHIEGAVARYLVVLVLALRIRKLRCIPGQRGEEDAQQE